MIEHILFQQQRVAFLKYTAPQCCTCAVRYIMRKPVSRLPNQSTKGTKMKRYDVPPHRIGVLKSWDSKHTGTNKLTLISLDYSSGGFGTFLLHSSPPKRVRVRVNPFWHWTNRKVIRILSGELPCTHK